MNIMSKIRSSKSRHEIYLLIILVIFTVIISGFNRSFFTVENLFDILKSSSTFIIMAIGVGIVMISGGIDVSFPAIAAVAMHTTVTILNRTGGNILTAFLIACMIGICLGAVNAFIISYFKLPTLIATLASSNIFFGILLESVDKVHISVVPGFFSRFGKGYILSFTNSAGTTIGFSNLAFCAVLLLVVSALLMKYTTLGRNIYAIGGSVEASKRAGISVWKTQFIVYTVSGFLSGFASIINVAMISYVNPFDINSVTMDVIAAVVLGGVSLTGGIGSIKGVFLGVIMLFIIKNSLILMGVPSTWDSVIVGAIILASISLTMIEAGKNKV